MVYKTSLLISLSFAASTLAHGHSHSHGIFHKRDSTNGQLCGTQNGGKSCSAGWCCGPDGTCGQGDYYCSGPDCQFQYGPSCDANTIPPGPDTSTVPRTLFGSIPYGVVLTDCLVNGVVALTFDDGPYPYTSQLIDVLDAAGVKATFFVSGNNGAKNDIGLTTNPYYSVVKKAVNSGHQIASHTWTHQSLSTISQTDRMNQLYRNEAAFYDILGYFPTYMRPPYLDCTVASGCIADMKTLGYHIISVNLDTLDWKGNYTYSKSAFDKIGTVSTASSEFITLSHDILNQTVTDLVPYMLAQIKKYGYQTATVGECLGDPPVNWYRDLNGNPAGPGGTTTKYNVSTIIPSNLSLDGSCGGTKGYICPEQNRCCSQFGWCGIDTIHCNANCQTAFSYLGNCNLGSGSSSSSAGSSSSQSSTAGSSSAASSSAASSASSSAGSSSAASSSRASSSGSSSASLASSSSSAPQSSSGTRLSSTTQSSTGSLSSSAAASSSSGTTKASSSSANTAASSTKGSSSSSPPSSSAPASSAGSSAGASSSKPASSSTTLTPSGSTTTDGSCGGAKGYICPSGQCCSAWGWCGAGTDFCGLGCQSRYGTCTPTLSGSSSMSPSPSGNISPDGSCAGKTGYVCPDKLCCSSYGFCGSSTDFCGTGCQKAFGACAVSAASASASVSTSGGTSPDGTCGGTKGYKCATGLCCSAFGFCGSGSTFCGTGCQAAFGSACS